MHLIRMEAAKILVVFLIVGVELIIDKPGVFLFKDGLEHTLFRITILVITTVFGHFIYEEKRQTLDSFPVQLTLLLEVGLNCLPDLDALHMKLVGVANEIALSEGNTVGERNVSSGLSG